MFYEYLLEQRSFSDPRPLLTLADGCQMRVLAQYSAVCVNPKALLTLARFSHVGHAKLADLTGLTSSYQLDCMPPPPSFDVFKGSEV